MDAPAFDARFVRPALRSIVFCLTVFLISSMMTVKPAHASGTVASINTYFVAGSGFGGYINAATPAAACGDGGSQVTGPVVTQIISSQWQCTYTYRCDVGLPPSYCGTPYIIYAYYISPACPVNSTGTVTCTCNDPYVPDSTGTSCVPASTCLVPKLKDLPADDACAKSLDKGRGKDVDGKCLPLNPALPGQIQCFADKIAATNITARPTIPYTGPTAQYRNDAYQAHLKDIWDRMIELNKDENRNNQACLPRREKVIAEKGCDSNRGCAGECVPGSHCIRNIPATSSNHTQGTAFDVSWGTINGLLDELTPRPPAPMTPQQTIQAQRIWIADWLARPTACNLYWGGNFDKPTPDFIHFQLP
jgi:D-alanyl-D-alanine dipeptidase